MDFKKIPELNSIVRPLPLWNETTRLDKLPYKCVLLEIHIKKNCGSGIMFVVNTIKGKPLCLDSDWFTWEGKDETSRRK